MAKAKFKGPHIIGMVTTAGDKIVKIEDECENFGIDEKGLKRLKKTVGYNSRYIVSDTSVCTSDLCIQSANTLLDNLDIDRNEIDALLFVTQTPDYHAPSTAIIMQDRLKLSRNTVAFDINLGCSGFIFGLFNAFTMVQSGLNKVLLCVGDISSQFANERDKNFTPLMGDAGSAILISNDHESVSHFVLHSDGSGYRSLIIPAGGREPITEEGLKSVEVEDGVFRKQTDLYMNGGEVFNFTIKVVPDMFDELFEYSNIAKNEIDYFVLHQANRYILKSISKKLELAEDKLPTQTVTEYGNQNSASIPGTINGYLDEQYSTAALKSVLAGYGIGLSWGACVLDTSKIYSPKTSRFMGIQK